jgi:hypothetical protein
VVRTESGAQWLDHAVAAGRLETRDVDDFPEAIAVRDRLARIQRRRPQRMMAARDGAGQTGFDHTAVLAMPVPGASAGTGGQAGPLVAH